MNNAIISTIIDSPDKLEAFFNLHQSYDQVRSSLVLSLQKKVKLRLRDGIKLHPMELGNTKENGIFFSSEFLEQRNLYICLFFEQNDFRACCFGLMKKDIESHLPCSEELKATVSEAMPEMKNSSSLWPVYGDWRHTSWTIETWKGVIDENETVPTQLAEDVNLLHETVKAFFADRTETEASN
jgi:hypothetical protein